MANHTKSITQTLPAPKVGKKQGCPLSPTLFGIYIDDFQAELETAGGDLDLPTLCGMQAPALFYADDLDLVSTSVRGLQAQLELLESFCTRWRLTVNVKGRKEIYMYALTKPHGSCRGSSGSDMHKQIKNQNRDIKHPTA